AKVMIIPPQAGQTRPVDFFAREQPKAPPPSPGAELRVVEDKGSSHSEEIVAVPVVQEMPLQPRQAMSPAENVSPLQ
ncbi:unnamed protein product, partial [Symbiodinium pilosum]